MYNKTRSRRVGGSSFWKNKSKKFGGGKRRFVASKIDTSLFINKVKITKEEDVFEPGYCFDDLPIDKKIKNAIAKKGFSKPTPIQDKAIPIILTGRDLIGLANTGTGKTAAFLIPMIHKLLANRSEKLIIIAPIRELAIQIQEDFRSLTDQLGLHSVVIVGGASAYHQITQLRRSPQVVIGTPGRLKDLIDRGNLNLSQFNNIVLDEADRMLDMGFIGDIRKLLSLANPNRQTLLFSATFSSQIEKISQEFLNNPEQVSLKSRETSSQIDQDIIRIEQSQDKVEILHDLLIQTHFEKVLVFTRTKQGADKLSKKLYQKGLKADAIHGDKPHNKRQRTLKMFKQSSIDILIATDVAARGLDIPDVSHVINFDLPATYDDYVHRIGRTGRASKKGIALTFVD